MSDWTPGAVRRLIALTAGILFFAAGVALIVKGISSTGSLDIRSALISGRIQTGSAGLIIAFLSTIIIIFSSAVTERHLGPGVGGSTTTQPRGPTKGLFYMSGITLRLLVLNLFLATLLVLMLWVEDAFPKSSFGSAAEVATFFLGIGELIAFGNLVASFVADAQRVEEESAQDKAREHPRHLV